MTGRLSLSRMILLFLLPRTCAAVPLLFHTMGLYRTGSGVRLWVYLSDMGIQIAWDGVVPDLAATAVGKASQQTVATQTDSMEVLQQECQKCKCEKGCGAVECEGAN